MFASSFPYRKINHQARIISGHSYIEHNYSFKGKTNKRYIVVAEEYQYFVFVVKFYLQEHKSCEHRFNRITGINECTRIITTTGMIMRELALKNPYASFGFVGSNSIGEEKNNTKRFRLYSRAIENLISPVLFEHRPIPSKSAYLMINRNNIEEGLIDKIETLFRNIYNF